MYRKKWGNYHLGFCEIVLLDTENCGVCCGTDDGHAEALKRRRWTCFLVVVVDKT